MSHDVTPDASGRPEARRAGSLLSRLTGFDEAGLLLGFIFLVLLIGIPHPEFFNAGSLEAVLRQTAFVAIIAFGMVFLVAMVEIDLSVSGIYAVAGMSMALLIKAGVDPWAAAAVALLAGCALGLLNGLLAALFKVPLIIISLGTMSMFFGLNLMISGGLAVFGMPRDHSFFTTIGGTHFGLPMTVWITIATGLVLHVVLWRTRYGASVRAIGSNPKAAAFLGLRVARIRILTTMFVGFLAALSGILTLAFFKASEPTIGMGIELRVIAAVVIGGTSLAGGSGTILGAALGALIITLIDSGIVFYGIDPDYSQFVTGTVIVAAIGLDRLAKRRKPS
ncbi:ABC transporter permease [Celeribacter indicus]|uniref:Sugar ABC transporter n=1 Tax=Celeribacter indicus TaxID=1208324 RepID=A0A0B5DP06_9RHOB|nr:ABC transporter permease [Celeribacter indicus]AJE44944.1 sugar ABC transporter [Celeribacter indicus]SDW96664.1 ribose transport system permease protein [Celeribacter indicus]